MTDGDRRWRSALAAAVIVALLGGAVLLAVTRGGERSTVAEGCAAAGSLDAEAVVAIVDSGITRSALPEARFWGERTDLTGEGPSVELAAHGTEMASIVAEAAPEARLVDVRVLDGDGSGTAQAVADGVDAAMEAGTDVINLSAEIQPTDPAIRQAIERAVDEGAVVVIAAGNDHRDLSRDPAWREVAVDPCIVVVGATDADDTPLRSSSYGAGVIDVWTLGESVPAIDPDGDPVTASGTSPAAASVTGELISGG